MAAIFLGSVAISGCSKTPKEEALSGIYDGCYITENKELKKFCKCITDEIDKSFPEDDFRKSTPREIYSAINEKQTEILEKCKKGIKLH